MHKVHKKMEDGRSCTYRHHMYVICLFVPELGMPRVLQLIVQRSAMSEIPLE